MSDERERPRDDAGVPSPDLSNDMTPHDVQRDAERDAERDTQHDAFAAYDLDGYVLGALSDDEAATVRAAIAADPQLADEVRLREELVAQLAFAAAPQQINRGRSAGIRSRLISKVASSREGHVPVSRKTAELLRPLLRRDPASRDSARDGGAGSRDGSRGVPAGAGASSASYAAPLDSSVALRSVRRRYRIALGAVAAAAAAIIGWQQSRVQHANDGLRSEFESREQATARRLDSFVVASAKKDSVIASFSGPNMKVIDLINYSSQSPLARMFWDQKTAEWSMYAYHMRQPKPGKTFQVWLVTTTSPAPISAGTFAPNPDGSYVMHAKYPLDPKALVKVAVSEEPAGGVPAPTGPIIIAGAGR